MSDTLVTVDNASKKFCRSLKKSLWYGAKDTAAEFLGIHNCHSDLREGEFWANKDISFQLKRGETIGLIGHNGAGKTTLLRMLNGLIRPDKGYIKIRGRVQALIALGAGFNPILSGRENVYVNAAVLGFTRAEIDKRLENIIDFADIGEFIDAPVQSYSSGMAVRLGFAVAAHMDPDVLLVDEVLAVGDINFRRKCNKRIRDFRENGAGIIIVSHDISHLYNLCDQIIYLSKGEIIQIGKAEYVTRRYFEDVARESLPLESPKATQKEMKEAEIEEVLLLDANDSVTKDFKTGDPLKVVIKIRANEKLCKPVVGVGFAALGGQGGYLTACNTKTSNYHLADMEGSATVRLYIDSIPLYPGTYDLVVTLNDSYGLRYDSREGVDAIRFKVNYGKMGAGDFYMKHTWS